MTAKDLKNALLQEAVQGKLVPQIASEGNARDLLEEIRKKRGESLPLATARKRSSATPSAGTPRNAPMEISEDEIPFDIPENWCWCRLGEIVNYKMGKTPPRAEAEWWGSKKDTPWISIADMNSDGYISKTKETMSPKSIKEVFSNNVSPKGTLIMSFKLTVGRVSILDIDATHNEAIISIFPFIDDNKITRDYLFKLLPLLSLNGDTKDAIKGRTLNSTSLSNMLIPLPPLAEQKRIVAAIEKFMPLIEEYGKKETVLNELNAQIGTLTKKAILQEAVQGKLVPQIPAEGNAKDLLEQIKAQKAALIKEGKIKKEKPMPEITEDEIPFDIPENWCWCRLGDLITYQNGYAYNSTDMSSIQKGYPVIKSGSIMTLEVVINSKTDFIEKPTKKMLESVIVKNDLLMCLSSQSNNPEPLGKTAIYKLETPALLNQRVLKMKCIEIESLFFLYYVINSEYFHYSVSHQGGGSAQANLKLEHVTNMLIPLPPLSEQKRIVTAIEQLLPLCEKLGK